MWKPHHIISISKQWDPLTAGAFTLLTGGKRAEESVKRTHWVEVIFPYIIYFYFFSYKLPKTLHYCVGWSVGSFSFILNAFYFEHYQEFVLLSDWQREMWIIYLLYNWLAVIYFLLFQADSDAVILAINSFNDICCFVCCFIWLNV